MRRFREVPLAKEQALMPTFPDKDAAAKLGRPSRLQPSPDPRLQGSTIANASNATLAQRAAEVAIRQLVHDPIQLFQCFLLQCASHCPSAGQALHCSMLGLMC